MGVSLPNGDRVFLPGKDDVEWSDVYSLPHYCRSWQNTVSRGSNESLYSEQLKDLIHFVMDLL